MAAWVSMSVVTAFEIRATVCEVVPRFRNAVSSASLAELVECRSKARGLDQSSREYIEDLVAVASPASLYFISMSQNSYSDAHARRNARVLAGAQALGGAIAPIVVSLGGVVGQMLTSIPALATLPVSMFNLGMALGTLPAALLMRRFGRRKGYLSSAIIGVVAGLGAAYAIAQASFLLFCLATLLAGTYSAYVQSYRFAATDGASPDFRPRAISWVMVGGLVGAVVGPQTVIYTRELWPAMPFAGSFVAQAVLVLLSLPILWMLRDVRMPVEATEDTAGGRTVSTFLRTPRFLLAVGAGVVSFSLMSLVMTAAPLAMVACGHTVGQATMGIQWHVLAMFGPSFVTGRLINRFGAEWVTAWGLVLSGSAAAVALMGLDLAHFYGTLVLIGVGWNFGFIGATAMVAELCTHAERTRVQALNDFLVFGSVAASSFLSGILLNVGGWELVNMLVFPAVAAVLVPLLWSMGRERRTAS